MYFEMCHRCSETSPFTVNLEVVSSSTLLHHISNVLN